VEEEEGEGTATLTSVKLLFSDFHEGSLII
jgi:hypothetical protein